MLLQANGFLLLGALLTALAGVLHFACIFWGRGVSRCLAPVNSWWRWPHGATGIRRW